MAHLFDLLRSFLANYGYWAVAAMLLLENAGLPVPGETILLLASFSAFSEHDLRLRYVVIVAVAAATLGDNIGFAIGHFGGRRLLSRYIRTFRISHRSVGRAEHLFQKYGAVTVFFARFVAGLRIIAGPLAGALGMHWKKFLISNFLGAAVWVMAIACVGYFFGQHWATLERLIRGSDLVFGGIAVAAAIWIWFRLKKSTA
jgi:membrane-associated protein